ncbi:fimbrillin family protein [Phocaeicola plebeius]|uniref:fimbrillin family protein n=1 Tax=Phocaeicola plebeius TaxID=310297 RepID=UPI0026E9D686|nr:fimbrillin family protein [Phocaeicola plebeius]
MKMYFKNLIFALAGALAMTACSNEMEQQLAEGSGNSGQEVKFTVGIENLSRTAIAEGEGVLKTTFVNEDAIGIFAYKEGEDEPVYTNVKYIYNGSDWTSDKAITSDGTKLSYYAYYPYMDGVTDPSQLNITVSTNQASGFSKDDVLTAQNTTAEAGAENVTLSFSHAFAMVQVGIKSGLTDDAEATVTLESILPTAVVNAKAGTVGTASGEKTSIQMQKTNADKWEYRAIVPAQDIASGSKLLTIVAEGKTYAVTYSSAEGKAVSYEAGKALQITVNSLVALPDGDEVTIGGSITDWDASTSDPGEGDVTEVPTESLDLSALPGLDFATIVTKAGWNTEGEKVTGKDDFWFKREVNLGRVTYEETVDNEISMTLADTIRATWNNNSIGFHSGLKFDFTKKYTLTFKARAAGERTDNNIGLGISSSDDKKLFCKSDLSGTVFTKAVAVSDEYTDFSFTFDFSQVSTATKGAFGNDDTYSSATLSDTDGGINIVFYNNTDVTKNKDKGSSIIYVKNIKLEVVKE